MKTKVEEFLELYGLHPEFENELELRAAALTDDEPWSPAHRDARFYAVLERLAFEMHMVNQVLMGMDQHLHLLSHCEGKDDV